MPRHQYYSPQLDRDVVTKLYHLAKERRVPMTRLASAFVRRCLMEETNASAMVREDSPVIYPQERK